MKVFAILAAATLAVASAQVPECSPALVEIVRGPDTAACTAATGYSPLSFSVPTGADLVKVCSDKSCQALLAAVNTAVPTECTYATITVKATIVDPITKACDSLKTETSAAPATTTTAPATTTTAPTATTVAPATTTVAPAATTAAPAATTEAPKEAGSGSAPLDEIQSPAEPNATASNANATTPAPVATQSSASSVIAAAGAVVVAVAASLL